MTTQQSDPIVRKDMEDLIKKMIEEKLNMMQNNPYFHPELGIDFLEELLSSLSSIESTGGWISIEDAMAFAYYFRNGILNSKSGTAEDMYEQWKKIPTPK